MSAKYNKKYLIYFASEHPDFQVQEIKSVADVFGINYSFYYDDLIDIKNPFLVIGLSSEQDARLLMSRSVLSKSIFELWLRSDTFGDIFDALESLPADLVEGHEFADDVKMTICSHGMNIAEARQVSLIDALMKSIPLRGRVNLSNPERKFALLLYFSSRKCSDISEADDVYFGRWICDSSRDVIHKYNLKDRVFIANTSMDPGLSHVMANSALVKPGDIVYDPFCGSGSILVSAAHWGGLVLGADIDFCLLHGKTKPSRQNETKRGTCESVRSNLKQYNLEGRYLDVLVMDAAHSMFRSERVEFDAIITDPPYGVRERSIKVGSEKTRVKAPRDESFSHFPEMKSYDLKSVLSDLFNAATRYLKLRGRLVFWLPVSRGDYDSATFVPSHPCFRLVGNCEQVLNSRTSRRLLTYEKSSRPSQLQSSDLTIDGCVTDFRKLYFMSSRPTKTE